MSRYVTVYLELGSVRAAPDAIDVVLNAADGDLRDEFLEAPNIQVGTNPHVGGAWAVLTLRVSRRGEDLLADLDLPDAWYRKRPANSVSA